MTKNIKKQKKNIAKEKVPAEKIVLSVIGVVGIMSVALIAPNAMQMLKLFGFGKKKYPEDYFNKALSRLINKGYVRIEKTNKGRVVKLTKKGKDKLKKYQDDEKSIKKPKRWDGKWRMVIFDIKEEKKGLRHLLRQELIKIGFVQLQKSVWVYPYDCEELLIMLKSKFKLGKEVLYITAEKIENDKELRKKFNLPLQTN